MQKAIMRTNGQPERFITVSLPESLHAQLWKEAHKREQSLSAYVRKLFADALRPKAVRQELADSIERLLQSQYDAVERDE